MAYVVIRTWQLTRVWKRRRARSVQIFLIEIVAQLVREAKMHGTAFIESDVVG